jgi:hypothetical protein
LFLSISGFSIVKFVYLRFFVLGPITDASLPPELHNVISCDTSSSQALFIKHIIWWKFGASFLKDLFEYLERWPQQEGTSPEAARNELWHSQ